ncbi:MAG: hypothetical protein SPG09_03165 [Lachnospiraceae bacterium]|nr:hypothetical protein [bacterium]MDY5516602.1 hypothetical protein [Lachnospiraceae bacterium]
MKEIVDFFKEAGMFFIATDDDGQPRVRPFGELFPYGNDLCRMTPCLKRGLMQKV